jgi:hypothetical protein
MFGLRQLFYPWGFLVQIVALVHFVRRRPDNYWLYIIFFGGFLGASAYIVVEVLPDAGLLRGVFQGFGRRSRIQALEIQIIDNPAAGNYEELGELCLEQKQYAKACEAFDKAIAARSDSPHAFYNRAKCYLGLGDLAGAIPDLEHVVRTDAKFDYYRAAGLLADAYARTGQLERAAPYFAEATQFSTTPERSTIMRTFCACRIAATKHGSGRRSLWPRSGRCRATCREWSGRGSAKARNL